LILQVGTEKFLPTARRKFALEKASFCLWNVSRDFPGIGGDFIVDRHARRGVSTN
jgi:hypothetical protein